MNHVQFVFLLEGLKGTVILSILTFLFGGILAFLLALARISPVYIVRLLVSILMQIVQGIPLLVIMGMVFFGPSLINFYDIGPLTAATVAMSIYSAAFLGDI